MPRSKSRRRKSPKSPARSGGRFRGEGAPVDFVRKQRTELVRKIMTTDNKQAVIRAVGELIALDRYGTRDGYWDAYVTDMLSKLNTALVETVRSAKYVDAIGGPPEYNYQMFAVDRPVSLPRDVMLVVSWSAGPPEQWWVSSTTEKTTKGEPTILMHTVDRDANLTRIQQPNTTPFQAADKIDVFIR